MAKKVIIIPCSGVGKANGEIGRQAAYEAVDNRPGKTTTVCLARIMIDDAEAAAALMGNPVITVDGCAKDCARKNVESAGAKAQCSLRVIDVFKEHRDLKPAGVIEIGEAGFQLAHFLAERVLAEADRLLEKEGQPC